MLCCYKNHTSEIQVVKIIEKDSFEKIIFPHEKFLFDAPVESELKIFIENAGKIALLNSIPCQYLQSHAPIESGR